MIEEEKYLNAYFGNQPDYYLEKYKAYYSGDQYTFNVGAFLAGFFWFLYRKLYIQAAVIFFILLIIGTVEGIIYDLFAVSEGVQNAIFGLSTIAFASLYGFIGNTLYIKHADKRIKNILAKTGDDERRIELLRKSGGVSWAPYVVLVLAILLLFIINNTQN